MKTIFHTFVLLKKREKRSVNDFKIIKNTFKAVLLPLCAAEYFENSQGELQQLSHVEDYISGEDRNRVFMFYLPDVKQAPKPELTSDSSACHDREEKVDLTSQERWWKCLVFGKIMSCFLSLGEHLCKNNCPVDF